MKLKKLVLSSGLAVAFALTASSPSLAKKCKDGETPDVASYKIEKGAALDHAINQSLTGKAGDAKKGLKHMVHRRQGNCIACHKVSAISNLAKPSDLESMKKYAFHGETGPSLDGVASRYTEGELRMLMVDVKKIFPDTLMPSFHRKDGLHKVHKDCAGKAVMSAEKVEDVVAYLKTLK